MTNNLGTEYYPLTKYAEDNLGNQIYATKNGAQFYLRDSNGNEIMAKKLNSKRELVPYFALDADSNPICPLLSKNQNCLNINIHYPKIKNKEIYPKRGNCEYYINNGSGMQYAKNGNVEYYATNSQGKFYYASKISDNNEEIEYPIKDKDNKYIFIEEDDIIIYPINKTQNIPIYSKNDENKEIYFKKNDKECYGYNLLRLPIYAKDENENDYLALDKQNPYYSFYKQNGSLYEYYPKMKNSGEYYLKRNNREIYAKFKNVERYARTKSNNDIFAKENNLPYYATNDQNLELYPNVDGKNVYRIEGLIEKIAINKTNSEGFYAKNEKNDEFYPKDFNKQPDEKIEIVNENMYQDPTLDQIENHISSRIN